MTERFEHFRQLTGSGFRAGIMSGVEVLSRVFATGVGVLIAVMTVMDAGTNSG